MIEILFWRRVVFKYFLLESLKSKVSMIYHHKMICFFPQFPYLKFKYFLQAGLKNKYLPDLKFKYLLQAFLRNKVSMICFLPVSWSTDSRSILSATASRSVIQHHKIEKLAWFFLEIPFQFILYISLVVFLIFIIFFDYFLLLSCQLWVPGQCLNDPILAAR